MRALLISKTFTKGGAASGARNLMRALCAAGVEVVVFDAYANQRYRPIKLCRFTERVYERTVHDAETHCLRIGPPVFDLKGLYDEYKPDVIQLCDVSGNTIAFEDISELPCPVVHRMSDFWPYHGARHYAEYMPAYSDLADRILRRLVFDGSVMPDCRVAPSHWLATRLGGGDVEVIRNAVTIPEGITPRSAHQAALRFGFISGQVMDPRKGFKGLPPFLEGLRESTGREIELHIFGDISKGSLPKIANTKIVSHSRFKGDELARVYGSIDILLCPSRQDNSPNVVTEAFAHGVPVIAQARTGMDTYIQLDTGALIDFQSVNQENIDEFDMSVHRILSDFGQYSRNSLEYASAELAPATIGQRYVSLYNHLLTRVPT